MSRDEVLTKLRQHAPVLQAEGILHLALFGSTARNEARPDSDVDLMAEYDPNRRLGLFELGRIHYTIEDLLGTKVDLANRLHMRPIIKESAEEDAIDAF
ncbi:MAG: nucleotidyltransferase family protein [Acidobacteria bacterium]|nr:nucleotidyltransferase family protein [Acidobacteriota bacterium]